MTGQLKLKRKDADALREFVEKLRARLGADLLALKLFGSKASGRDAPDSDIDVAVIVNEGSPEIWDQTLDAAFEVNLSHDVYISPRVIEQRILADPVWRITPFLRAVEEEGLSL